MPARRWTRFWTDAENFLRDFGAAAVALGWSDGDLFGHDDVAPWARVDRLGLIWLLDGQQVIAIDEGAAHIQAAGGGRRTFYRRCAAKRLTDERKQT